jgi:catechol 2,3-dioxygenase-like lactoylglutathione lyase family enzyme
MSSSERHLLEPWIEEELAACRGRTILVDGFNVLHAAILVGRRGRDWWSAENREPLLERVEGWPEVDDVVWVVFDGAGPQWSVRIGPGRGEAGEAGDPARAAERAGPAAADPRGPRVHVFFAASADDWIVRRARRAPAPDRLVVVSADREVAGRARSAGCEILPPRAFVSRCARRAAGG